MSLSQPVAGIDALRMRSLAEPSGPCAQKKYLNATHRATLTRRLT
jgi:hypothetical protein